VQQLAGKRYGRFFEETEAVARSLLSIARLNRAWAPTHRRRGAEHEWSECEEMGRDPDHLAAADGSVRRSAYDLLNQECWRLPCAK
jgi:hypothetical protein